MTKADAVLPQRFVDEARASLPGLTETSVAPSLAEVFGALQVQRLRLRYDQQVSERAFPRPSSATEACGW